LARVSSCSTTGIGALITTAWAFVTGAPPASAVIRVSTICEPAGTV
jgi:hypothetical protein